MEKIVELCKRRGFIFPGSEIYGGMANTWDFGPLGVELKNNIKQAWWRKFVQQRSDVVGLESALIMNPKVWQASGHVDHFHDELIECKECHGRFRSDETEKENVCPLCGAKGSWTEPAKFNTMFKTFVGPKEEEADTAYLRPETAQGMFVDWPQVAQTSRQRLPFGVAQIGKAFRNEITPGNYIFRTREFEQMEIEYFIKAEEWEEHFGMWLKQMHEWLGDCGVDMDRVHDHEIPDGERAHYSKRTVDIEFEWPFGRKELYGLAYRGDYDLKLHADASGRDFTYTDPNTGEKFLPHVIEPSFGLERTLLAVLLSAYSEEDVGGEQRTVLRLPSSLAPYQVAVLPLSRKDELTKIAEPLAQDLRKSLRCDYDVTQSIGKRYRRQDEIGTPYCVTVDFDSIEDGQATVRERDSMKQERMGIDKIGGYLEGKLLED